MPRPLLYVSAAVIVMCLVVTVLKVTTYAAPPPPCPHCGAVNARLEQSAKNHSLYVCRKCGETFEGPPRSDFSWWGAIRVMLQDAGYRD